MATLFEMTQQATELYEMLQAEEIDEQTFSDTLEAMGTGEKIEGYCQVIKQVRYVALFCYPIRRTRISSPREVRCISSRISVYPAFGSMIKLNLGANIESLKSRL